MLIPQFFRQIWLSLPLVVVALGALTGCQGVSGGNSPQSAGTLLANPASLAFGNTQVGGSTKLSETLTNSGNSSVSISKVNANGAAFSISGLTLPITLSPGQSVTFTGVFEPSTTGSASGAFSVVSDASNSPLSVALSGTGTDQGQLSVSPTQLDFGTIAVGSSSTLKASLSAAGAPVTVSSAGSNSSEFVLSGITFPTTISDGQSLQFKVTFTPNAAGAAAATLTFVSDASNSPTKEALTGSGQAAGSHWVDLTWDASSGAVSYNVYRKLVADSNFKPIDSGDGTAAYTDNNVTAGKTYDYVVTSVDAQGQESGYSKMVEVSVPKP
jgi:Abnormal spindle-like microcephaly-assoc'd, ASPM-SPD-2-Hydin